MKKEILGQSSLGKEIELWELTQGPKTLLLMAGVHGDEVEGIHLVQRFVEEERWKAFDGRARLLVIPCFNPDGFAALTRQNGNGVDLNRNMPTKDWDPVAHNPRYQPGPKANSENESQILVDLIEKEKLHFVLTAHSWKEDEPPLINYNGPCRNVAEHMSQFNQHRVEGDVGYPTPGSHGTYLGWELKIPTITLEIARGLEQEKVWEIHSEALYRALEYACEHNELG